MIPRTREALAELLDRSVPANEAIDAATVDAFIDALMRHAAHRPPEQGPVGAPTSGAVYRLRATHARRTPVTSVFTAETAAVRVDLPQHEPRAISTVLGRVLPSDHLVCTVDSLRDRFGSRLERPLERVELITQARSAGTRFAPMSLFLGYAPGAEHPNFVVFEPGDATGKPGALYLAPTIDSVIEEPAGYQPTPLSSVGHWYTGGLRMTEDGRHPRSLFMHASVVQGGEPHFRLHVDYSVEPEASTVIAGRDLAEAVLRMLAIQKSVGAPVGMIERLMADAGLSSLAWVERPDIGPGPVRKVGPCEDFENCLGQLSPSHRAALQRSVAMLLRQVVHADGRLDRLERIELDWTLNFELPAALGDAFRFSPEAEREYQALMEGAAMPDERPFETKLAELSEVVAALPPQLRDRYTSFAMRVCVDAAESSGRWLLLGKRVDDREKAVLDRIAGALGLSVSATMRA